MKKIILLLLVLIFIFPIFNAEPAIDWVKKNTIFYVNSQEKILTATDSKDNVIVGLRVNNYWVILKYDEYGQELGYILYNDENVGLINDLAVDSEDNVIVTGNYYYYNTLTVKFDKFGNKLWSVMEGKGTQHSLAIDTEDNVIVNAVEHKFAGINNILYKYNKDGGLLWSLIEKDYDERITDITTDSENNIITSGKGNANNIQIIIKYNQLGVELWRTTFGTQGYFGSTAIATDSENNIIVGISDKNPDTLSSDYYIRKFNPEGNELWVANYDTGYTDSLRDLKIDSKDQIIVTGASTMGPFSEEYTTVGYGKHGCLLWKITYGKNQSGFNLNRPFTLALDSKDNIIVVGLAYLAFPADIHLIKYNRLNPDAPIFVNPTINDGHNYKICDNINFNWVAGDESNDIYYVNARLNCETQIKDFQLTNNKLFLDWRWVELEAKDGEWDYWICNGPNNYQCTEHRFIYKNTTPSLISPIDETIVPGTIFEWTTAENAHTYAVKLTGYIGPKEWTQDNPLYLNLKSPLTTRILKDFEYDLFKGNEFSWSIAPTCNMYANADYMSKLEYSDTANFYK